MELYHGTDNFSAADILKFGIDFSKCNSFTDNSLGFYTTESYIFAKKRAEQIVNRQKLNSKYIKPVVIKFIFNYEISENIKIKTFKTVSDEWKYFVVANRIGKNLTYKYYDIFSLYKNNLDNKYDIVIDPTADAGIADIVSEIKYHKNLDAKHIKSKIDGINVGKNQEWDNQISFHSEKVLKLLNINCIMEAE